MKAGMQPYWIKDMDRYLFKNIMDDGMEISGGEAQKVALARAIYKDSEIIILDEPTSAMDVLAEEKIYKDFNEMVGNKTVFFISHRLFSCKFCDLILVFDLEGVVMKGNHEELMADRDGLYYKMWMAQAKYF